MDSVSYIKHVCKINYRWDDESKERTGSGTRRRGGNDGNIVLWVWNSQKSKIKNFFEEWKDVKSDDHCYNDLMVKVIIKY